MEEILKPLEDNPDYLISNYGKFYSTKDYGKRKLRYPRELKPMTINTGYLVIQYWGFKSGRRKKLKMLLHRAVALYFIENPKDYQCVLHRDNNILNCHVENLRWGSLKMNQKQSIKQGRKHVKSKKTKIVFKNGTKLYFKTQTEVAEYLGINMGKVSKIVRGELKQPIGLKIKTCKNKTR